MEVEGTDNLKTNQIMIPIKIVIKVHTRVIKLQALDQDQVLRIINQQLLVIILFHQITHIHSLQLHLINMKITQKMSGHQDHILPLIILTPIPHFQMHLKIIQTITTVLTLITILTQIINLNLIALVQIINHIKLHNQYNQIIVIPKATQITLTMDNTPKISRVLTLWLSYKGERSDEL